MVARLRVLLVGSEDEDMSVLDVLISSYASVKRIRTVPELNLSLRQFDCDVVVSNWAFDNATWKLAVELTLAHVPSLPVIVCCPCGGEAEWIEVLNTGGFDLLVRPYTPASVFSVLEQAAATRQGREWHGEELGQMVERRRKIQQ